LGRNGGHPLEEIAVLPVFSNLGELDQPSFLGDRPNRLVAYGIGRTGQMERTLKCLESLAAELQLEELAVMGPSLPRALQIRASLKQMPHLSRQEASDLLTRSRFGYLDYYPGYLAKSGILAAFCAHGLATFTRMQPDQADDGLFHGRQFHDLDRASALPSLDAQAGLARNANAWYLPHNINKTAEKFAEVLTRC
jgi:hypothetical protein